MILGRVTREYFLLDLGSDDDWRALEQMLKNLKLRRIQCRHRFDAKDRRDSQIGVQLPSTFRPPSKRFEACFAEFWPYLANGHGPSKILSLFGLYKSAWRLGAESKSRN